MSILLRHTAGALAAAGLIAGASSTAASVLYDNGAVNGSIGNWTIGGAGGLYAVSDSFTLESASAITSINFGVWTFPGDSVSTLDWGITTTPGSFSGFVYGGTAAVMNGTPSLNSIGWAISTDSFSTGAISLAAGVYYLVLQNAVATNSDAVYWDVTNGLSSAVQNIIGNLAGQNGSGSTGSESFQVVGSDADDIPEPASWALMLVGLTGLGAVLRLRRPGGAAAGALGRNPGSVGVGRSPALR